jgi:hypothetical protein
MVSRAAVTRRANAADKVRRAFARLLAPRSVLARLPRDLRRDALGHLGLDTRLRRYAQQRSGGPLKVRLYCTATRRARAPSSGPAVLPPLRRQCRSAATARAGPHPRQLPAHASGARRGPALVDDHAAPAAGEDRRQDRPPRPIDHQPNNRVVLSRSLFRQILAAIAARRSTQAARC